MNVTPRKILMSGSLTSLRIQDDPITTGKVETVDILVLPIKSSGEGVP